MQATPKPRRTRRQQRCHRSRHVDVPVCSRCRTLGLGVHPAPRTPYHPHCSRAECRPSWSTIPWSSTQPPPAGGTRCQQGFDQTGVFGRLGGLGLLLPLSWLFWAPYEDRFQADIAPPGTSARALDDGAWGLWRDPAAAVSPAGHDSMGLRPGAQGRRCDAQAGNAPVPPVCAPPHAAASCKALSLSARPPPPCQPFSQALCCLWRCICLDACVA